MKRALVLAMVLAAAPSRGAAQTTVSLTLDDAIARGLAASHVLAEAIARGEAAEAVAGERRAAMRPLVAAQASFARTNHVDTFAVLLPNNQLKVIYPDIPDNYRTRIDLQWPIFTGGRLDGLERAARAEASASAGDLAAARSGLRLEITRAYWALVTAIELLRVVDESVARVDAHLQDVRNQFAAGLVPPNDVSSVEAQQARQRMFSIQARATREVAAAALARLVGTPFDTPIQPASPLEAPAPVASPLSSLVEEAHAGRSERAALVKRVAAAAERSEAAAAGRKPTVAIAAGVDYARPNPRIFPRDATWRDGWDASVNMNWPLFDGGRTRAEVAETAANRRAIEERLAEFDSTLAVEVRRRVSELESSRAAISAADEGVRSADEARRVVGDRFRAGVVTSTDVLDAQVALLQAGLDRAQAIANARLAEAQLARALGK